MDGPPAVALGLESSNKSVMESPPRNSKKSYIDRKFAKIVLFDGIVISIFMALLMLYLTSMAYSQEKYITISFFTMVCFQLFNALNCRSFSESFYKGLIKNKYLILSILLSFAILVASISIPALGSIMQTTALSPLEILLATGYAALILAVEETRKRLFIK